MTDYQQRTLLAEVVAVWRDRPIAHIPARTASSGLKIAAALLTSDNALLLRAVEVRCQEALVAKWVSDHKNWRCIPVPAIASVGA